MRFLAQKYVLPAGIGLLLAFSLGFSAQVGSAANRFTPAKVVDDEGGPVSVTGTLTYTNAYLFTLGLAQPVVILEDQAGFVDRDPHYIIPVRSQTLGQFTSDFDQSPVSYSLALPAEPLGSPRDVDQNGSRDVGVQIFAIAYWDNIFGDPFLEERDLLGGGWSNAYASTRFGDDPDHPESRIEVAGGKYIVYAPDDQQGFPSDFGDDGRLFSGDDLIVGLPQGYTLVDMDTHPFTFSRERHPKIDLIEPKGAAQVDFSDEGYADAFTHLVEKMRDNYAFTVYKGVKWDEKLATFRPRFEQADADGDEKAYLRALRDFALSIPDGHISAPSINEDYYDQYGGGLGMAVTELDDGKVVVDYIDYDGPAYGAGIQIGAQILSIDGVPIKDAIEKVVPYTGPFSSPHTRRLAQLAFVARFPVGKRVNIIYQNAYNDIPSATRLTAKYEVTSLRFSLGEDDVSDTGIPVEFSILPSGYGLVHINSLSDNQLLTVQLWERMIETLNQRDVPGLILDMRHNFGGSGYLAGELALYLFDQMPDYTNGRKVYDPLREDFYHAPDTLRRYLPPENLRYTKPLAVLIGPNCYSACEYFTYDMTLDHRATLVGQYPTAGLGGGITSLEMPDGITFQYPVGAGRDPIHGHIIIEGTGIAPDIKVPVDEDTIYAGSDYDDEYYQDSDPVLSAAIDYLDGVSDE